MRAALYGFLWLYFCSPWIVFIVLACMTTQPMPDLWEIVHVVFGTWFYLYHIWLPVRRKCYKLDKEFGERTKMY